jgi:hypothetical protein
MWGPHLLLLVRSVTAIADKLGLEFALFHRKRDGKGLDAPEKMELLVGDVKGKVCVLAFSPPLLRLDILSFDLALSRLRF